MLPIPQVNPAPRGGLLWAVFVVLSLALNLFLAAHLLNRKSAEPTRARSAGEVSVGETPLTNLTSAATETPETALPDLPPFHWSEIESADYRQYIANLRTIGVPEEVIRDIIVAELSQLYTKRSRDIWPQRDHQYWQKWSNERPNPKQLEQLTTLGRDQAELLQELLGVRIGRQELIDTLYLQVQGSERQLLFLTPEKRSTALQALTDADFESKEMKLHSSGSYGGRDEQKLFNEKLDALTGVLSDKELDEFHRRNSPAGSVLKSEVRYFNLTPEEYRQLLLAKEAAEGKQHTKDIVLKLFGDERAKEFELVSSAFYINARTGAEAEGITLERVEQAARLANDSMTAGLALTRDTTLTVEARKARLQELQVQADNQIKDLLGDKASQAVRRDLRNVLRSSAAYIKP